jgi:dihydrofolate reductase
MKNKPKITIYIATSIDGYIARKDHSIDWLDRVAGYEDDYGFKDHMDSIDTLIIGRKTYDIASTVDDPYPGKRVIVLSRSLKSVKDGMELYVGDIPALISKLHREGVKHIYIDGGTTISQFLELKLVDEMILSIVPVILGSGIPLYHQINTEISCKLVSSKSYPSGLVQVRYNLLDIIPEVDL